MSGFSDDMTVGEAREALRKLVSDGTDCPVCTQHAKVYRRKLTGRQARALVALFKAAGREYGHMPSAVGPGYEAAMASLLRYWGLIEEMPERREDGGRAGWWRVTERGEEWLRGALSIPSHAVVYDARCLRLDGSLVSVADALGEPFNLEQLLEERPAVPEEGWRNLTGEQPSIFGEEPTYNPPPAPTEAV